MKPAVGVQQQMHGILMGAETVTVCEKPIILVVPDISVFSSELADPLVPAGRLMEVGFDVAFRIPKHADTDGFQDFPSHGGTIITPEVEIILMEYDGTNFSSFGRTPSVAREPRVAARVLGPMDANRIYEVHVP